MNNVPPAIRFGVEIEKRVKTFMKLSDNEFKIYSL
jgi:hypothetical protein